MHTPSQDVSHNGSIVKVVGVKLIAGMIIDTVGIADTIRAIIGTSRIVDDLHAWDLVLTTFEKLGMVVGFIHAM